MTFKVNDKVKPSADFDFDMFGGPANADAVGTIIEIIEISPPRPDASFYGLILVDWDGEINDHTTAEYTGFATAAEIEADPKLGDMIRGMSVVAAE